MSEILEENTTIQNILKNYLKQENITVYKLSKDTKLTVKTIQNILENTNSSFRKKTLEKILVLKNLNTEDKKYIKELFENYNGSYKCSEIDWGEKEGKEVW